MNWRSMAGVLALVILLATAAPTFAQNDSSGETLPAGETEALQADPSQLPILVITNSTGETVPVQVEIADTLDERQTGLMGRTALAEDAGMFFVFDQEQIHSFWMKDTLIPLSIAFIDAQGRIFDIQDMQPLDETLHSSAVPAQYALEVNQGFFAERGVQVGDTVELPVQSEGEGEVPPEAPVEVAGVAAPDQDTTGEVQ